MFIVVNIKRHHDSEVYAPYTAIPTIWLNRENAEWEARYLNDDPENQLFKQTFKVLEVSE